MPSLKRLAKKMASWLKPAWIKCNELALGIKTEPGGLDHRVGASERPWWRGETFRNAKHDDNCQYATIDYWNVRKVVRVLKPGPEDIFYDIGCGMGRIVCALARKPLRKCVGVELSNRLCEVARQNAANLRRRKAPIEIVSGDAATADLSDGTIYFMFNPFGAATLRDTLENIRNSLETQPRGIKILYYNSVHDSVLETAGWLERVSQFESLGGLRVTVWQNRGTRPETSTPPR